MRRKLPIALSLFAVIGLTLVVWAVFSTPVDKPSALQAAPNAPLKQPNLSLWVPEEELKVWDPMNPNVNPVPWRVFELKRDNGERSADFRHTAIGKQVRVEGIAWGYEVKTELPKSRVIFEGGTVLVNGVDFNKPEIRGKSVRVFGSLRLETMPHPGFARQFPNYYCIDAKSFEIIDQIAEPNVVLD